jgi:N-glycosylase/DNA lyase
VELEHAGRLRKTDLAFLTERLATMLHLALDLTPFHRRMKSHADCAWMAEARAGRMLRGATFFEDVIKMILTTNCSWSFTERMNERLVAAFGSGTGEARDFPTPEALAASSEAQLRNDIKLGYRAPYVLALSRRVAAGALDIEAFRSSTAPAAALFKELHALEGVGPYAAGNLLKLLGRFDYLGLDSWCRAAFSRMYANGGPVSDADIERFYAPFDEWQGLVMWLDVTRQWYAEKFPFLATGV